MPESPADTIRRGAVRLHRKASAALKRDQVWLRRTAEAWEHTANAMDDTPGVREVPLSGDLGEDVIVIIDRSEWRHHDWTATLAAARALLGEASDG